MSVKIFANDHATGRTVYGVRTDLLGCIIGGAAYPLRLVPNNIAPGGLTGVICFLSLFFTSSISSLTASATREE